MHEPAEDWHVAFWGALICSVSETSNVIRGLWVALAITIFVIARLTAKVKTKRDAPPNA